MIGVASITSFHRAGALDVAFHPAAHILSTPDACRCFAACVLDVPRLWVECVQGHVFLGSIKTTTRM